jgi:hypothetical protein
VGQVWEYVCGAGVPMGVKDHAAQVCDSAAAEALDVFVTSAVVVDVDHGFDQDSLVSLAGFDHEYADVDSSMAGRDQTGELESSLVFVILAVALADEEVVQSPFPPLPPLPSVLLLSLP